MRKMFAIVKFLFAFVLIAGILLSIILSMEKSLPVIVAGIAVVAYVGLYSFYLIKTGIWNLRDKLYVLKLLALIGLIFHFFSMSYFLMYSLKIFPSKTESLKVFYTAIPFFLVGVLMGVYDNIQFYKAWKYKRSLKNEIV